MAEIKNFPNNVDEYIGAENVMKWLHGRTSGVFGADGNLSVTANGDMTVSVSDGVGWLANDKADGTVFWNDTKEQTGSALQLTILLSDPILPRIDRIVVSWDTVDYAVKPRIEVLKGTPNSNPTPPKLTNNTLKRQISLAQIYVAAAASKLAADNITDERLDGTVCGLVTNWITVDTTTMQGQFSEFLEQIKKELDMLHAGTDTMTKGEYDPNSKVSDAGGIEAYFDGAIYSDDSETTPENILSTSEEVLRKVYPVGAVYMSVNSADPADLFGFGTWERVKDRFLLAAGDAYAAGSTGGEATHTLTIDEMPNHLHALNEPIHNDRIKLGSMGGSDNYALSKRAASYDYSLSTDAVGGDAAHNNMPPYLVVYIWKRTA